MVRQRGRGVGRRSALVVVVLGSVAAALSLVSAPPAAAVGEYPGAVLGSEPFGYWRLGDGAGFGADEVNGHTLGRHWGTSTQGMEVGVPSTGRLYPPDLSNGANLGPSATSTATSLEIWSKLNVIGHEAMIFSVASTCYYQAPLRLHVEATGHVTGFTEMAVPGGTVEPVEVRSAQAVEPGEWHHLVLTAGSGSVRLYMDGILAAEAATLPGVRVCAGTELGVQVGPTSSRNIPLQVSLDEAAYYKRVLSPAEVRAHYIASGRVAPTLEASELNRPNPAAKCACGQSGVGEPIDTSSGNLYEALPGVTVPGRGPGLSFGLEFNSADVSRVGAAGPGWSSTVDMRLTTDELGRKVVRQENGSGVYFSPTAGGGWVAGPHVTASLEPVPDTNLLRFTRKHFTRFDFDETTGRLEAVSDLSGNTIDYLYSGGPTSTQVSSIVDEAGRSLSMTWNAQGRLTSVTDPYDGPGGSRTIVLSYDGSGRLTGYRDISGGQWVMTYDAVHRLTSRRAPGQSTPAQSVRTEYDSSGRAWRQTDRLGRQLVLSYDFTNPGWTRIAHPTAAGEPQMVQVDKHEGGLRVETIVGYGTAAAQTTTFGYDRDSRVVTSVTRNGKTTTYDLDPDTDVPLSVTDPTQLRTTWTYNALDQPLTETTGLEVTGASPETVDASQAVTSAWTYDSAGRMTSSTVAQGTGRAATTQFVRADPAHPEDVTSVVDGRGETWLSTYDPATGYPLSSTDPLGNRTERTFNRIGWPLTVTAPKGVATPTIPTDHQTTYAYDVAGRASTVTAPAGESTRTVLDANGNTASVATGITATDPVGDVTLYGYDAADQLTSVNPPGPGAKTYTYTALGQRKTFTNELGATWTTGYDAAGRLTAELDPLWKVTLYGYDAAGRLATVQQPGPGASCVTPKQSCVTYGGYDDAGRLGSIDYSDPSTPDVTEITYDHLGRRTAATSGGVTETWGWWETSALASHVDANGRETTFEWDDTGNLTAIGYPGAGTVARVFDEAGRLERVTDWAARSTSFGYDANGNWTSTTFPGTVNRDVYAHYQSDRMTSATWNKGTATVLGTETYARPAAAKGMVASTTRTLAAGTGTIAYDYDDRDRLEEAGSDLYDLDDASNLVEQPDGTLQVFDPAQRLCWSSPTVTTGSCATPAADATELSYDDRGNRTGEWGPAATGSVRAYGYDQANRLTSAAVADDLTGGEGQYHEVPSKRILDTRTATGTCVPAPCARMTTGTPVSVTVAGAPIPATGVAAVAVSVSVIGPSQPGFLRVNPTATNAAATVNFAAGETSNQFAIVPVVDGKIVLSLLGTPGQADVVVDVAGYYSTAAGSSGSTYHPVDPAERLVDTRAGSRTGLCPTALCSTLPAGTAVSVQAAGRAQLPASGVRAAVVSVTVTSPGSAGYLRVAPGSSGAAATVNFGVGAAQNDVVVVPVDSNGRFSLVSSVSVDVVVDVAGYFTVPPVGGAPGAVLETLVPARLADTRFDVGSCAPDCSSLVANQQKKIVVRGRGGVPAEATTAVLFVIATGYGGSGFVRVNPDTATGVGGSGSATLNFSSVQASAPGLLVMAPIAADGTVTVAASAAVDVIVDVSSYLAPPVETWRYRYGVDGIRSKKIAPGGVETAFTWSAGGGLPLLLGQHSGASSTWLVYGPGGQPVQQIGPDETPTWLHHDQLGSVRVATNTAGDVVSTRSWDAYGNPETATGASQPLLGYAGQYSDAETGLQYLRARYYDPATTQFLTRDPLHTTTEEPYGYAGSNPANATDPSGLYCLTGKNPNGSCRSITRGAAGAADDAWDGSGGSVVSGLNDYLEDISDIIERPNGPRTQRQRRTMAVGRAMEPRGTLSARVCPAYGCVEASLDLGSGSFTFRKGLGLAFTASVSASFDSVPCEPMDEAFVDIGPVGVAATRDNPDPGAPGSWEASGPTMGASPRPFGWGFGLVHWF